MKSISPSQLEKFLRCPRLWWAEKVMRLPTIDKGYGIFGTVLHGVVERYLLADETGRDPATGEAVDLYPPHWWVARDKFDPNKIDGDISRAERAHVKVLVNTAIEEGHLRRWPHRKIEQRMTRPVVDGINTNSYIDVLLPDGVIDHKTTKNMSYAKSENKLRENTQLLFYAREVIFRNPEIEEITGSHVYYSKDPADSKLVKTVSVLWHRDEILEAWEDMKQTVRQMQQIEELGKQHPWFDVPGPVKPQSACNAFGGCDFRPICGRRESVTRYKNRVERVAAQRSNNTHQREQRKHMPKNTADLFDEVSDKTTTTKKARKKTPRKKSAAKKKEAAPEVMTNGKVSTYGPAPWADENCPACSGIGFNSKGGPCRICVGRAEKADRPLPDDYEIELDDDGVITWTLLDEPEVEDDDVEDNEDDEDSDDEDDEDDEDSDDEDDEDDEEDPLPPRRRGKGTGTRAKKSTTKKAPAKKARKKAAKKATEKFTNRISAVGRGENPPMIFINCVPHGMESIMDVSEVFTSVSTELAEQQDAESYYDLDTWKRREAFKRVAPKMAEDLQGQKILCCTSDADQMALVDALAPLSVVVRGVR